MSSVSQGCSTQGGRETRAGSMSESGERWLVQDESPSVGIRWS